MGVLKHGVFPLLILLHTSVVFHAVIRASRNGRLAMIRQFGWEGSAERESLGLWEDHAVGILGGGHMAFWVAELWSVVVLPDPSHDVRGLLTVMELIWWGYGAYDAQRLGFPCAVAYGISAMLVPALIIHYYSKEPGLFAKNKNSVAGAKKKK